MKKVKFQVRGNNCIVKVLKLVKTRAKMANDNLKAVRLATESPIYFELPLKNIDGKKSLAFRDIYAFEDYLIREATERHFADGWYHILGQNLNLKKGHGNLFNIPFCKFQVSNGKVLLTELPKKDKYSYTVPRSHLARKEKFVPRKKYLVYQMLPEDA